MRRASAIERAAALLIASVALSGCFDDQRKELARCDLEAKRAGLYSLSSPANEPGHTIGLCMTAAGYEYSYADRARCTIKTPFYENPYCYRPIGRIQLMIYRTEVGEGG
jgi:hypothetical protein